MISSRMSTLLWITFILYQVYRVQGVKNGCVIVLTSYGTPYEIGYCIGKQFASQIAEIYSGYDYYVNRTVPWSVTIDGVNQFNIFKNTITTLLDSRFNEELTGLADGSGRTFNEILLLNLETEIRAMLGDAPITAYNDQNYTMYTGSSTFLFNTADSNTYYVHQHDLDSIFHKKLFILDATYVRPGSGEEIESFVSINVPAFLPGMMFASNREQFTYSIDNMYPKEYFRGGGIGVPYSIYIRSLLNETDEAASNLLILDQYKASPAVGPSIAVWETNTSSIDAYEIFMNSTGLQQTGSLKNVNKNYYFHFNEYQHLTPPLLIEEKYVTLSTLYRSTFMAQYINNNPQMANKAEVLSLISNNERYPTYPMYNDPNTGGRIGTMFSVLIYTSGGSNLLELYLDKPSTTTPQYKLNLTEYWGDTTYKFSVVCVNNGKAMLCDWLKYHSVNMASGLDQTVGWCLVAISAVIFIYYTVWVIVLPFVEPDQLIHQLFPPRFYAIALPLIAGVIALCIIGLFVCIVIVKSKKKEKKS